MTTQSPPDAPASPETSTREAATGPAWSTGWRRVLGDWHWQPPPWIGAARGTLAAQPPQRLGAIAALLLLTLLAGWLVLRPRPIPPGALTVRVYAPHLTDYSKTPAVVDTLTLAFSGSAAPIKDVGAAPRGLLMTPALAGTWSWSDDRSLVFKPASDWPVGETRSPAP